MSRPNDADIIAEAKQQELDEYVKKGLCTPEEAKRLSYQATQVKQNKFMQDEINKALDL